MIITRMPSYLNRGSGQFPKEVVPVEINEPIS